MLVLVIICILIQPQPSPFPYTTLFRSNVDPGVWEITQGIDTNDDDVADQELATHDAPFERSSSLEVVLPPRAATVLTLKLDRKSTRLNSSHVKISYAVFCLKKKKKLID